MTDQAKITFARPIFGRPKTPSEAWGALLPNTPLRQHLISFHALLLHLGAAGPVLDVAQHHLREIARFTSAPQAVIRCAKAEALRDFAETKVKNQTAGRMYEDLLAEADRIEAGR